MTVPLSGITLRRSHSGRETQFSEYSVIPCWGRQNPWNKKSKGTKITLKVFWNSEFCVCQTEDHLISFCFIKCLWAEWSDVPLLWVFPASSPSMKFYPRKSSPSKRTHCPSLPPFACAEVNNSAADVPSPEGEGILRVWKDSPAKDHFPSSFSIRINCLKTGMECQMRISGWTAGARVKGTQLQRCGAETCLGFTMGLSKTLRGGMNRHAQELGWLENLKTHISYFWIIFLHKAQPTPGHKSGPEHVPATVLTLQWKHNRFRESQPRHRIHQNNLRITDVQQHIQRLLGYLRIQFRRS